MSSTDENVATKAAFELGCDHMQNNRTQDAARSFELAAKQGHTKAKNMFGVLIMQMGGDIHIAYDWICQAADEGNDVAMNNRDTLKRVLDSGNPGPYRLPLFFSW